MVFGEATGLTLHMAQNVFHLERFPREWEKVQRETGVMEPTGRLDAFRARYAGGVGEGPTEPIQVDTPEQPRKPKLHTYSMLRPPEEEAAAHLPASNATAVDFIDLTDCDAEPNPESPK